MTEEQKNNETTEDKVATPENAIEDTSSTSETTDNTTSAELDPIQKLQQDAEEWKDKYLRLYSEFDNYKKRTSKERIDLLKTAHAEMIVAVLPILDDFDRALKSMETAVDIAAIQEGVTLIHGKMKSILESKGLKEMGAAGMPFDSELHDAITNIPAPTEDLKGKVVDEVQKGYFLNDKVVRHAKVVVGQ